MPIFLVQFAVITIPILNRSKCVLLLEGQPYSEIVVTYKLIPRTHNAGNGKNPLKCKKYVKKMQMCAELKQIRHELTSTVSNKIYMTLNI